MEARLQGRDGLNAETPADFALVEKRWPEFLRREYWDASPWYGIAGYAAAAATGYLRMYNNKHWLGDVVAGAGVGILSADFAYYIYPRIKKLFVKHSNGATIVIPAYRDGSFQMALLHHF